MRRREEKMENVSKRDEKRSEEGYESVEEKSARSHRFESGMSSIKRTLADYKPGSKYNEDGYLSPEKQIIQERKSSYPSRYKGELSPEKDIIEERSQDYPSRYK